MRRRHFLTGVTACATAPWAARAAGLSGAADPSIVIGFIATRTGAGAIASQDAVDGFTLGLKQLGGRFSNQEVRVVAVDDKGSADIAAKVVDRMVRTERLDMVVTAVSQPSMAAIVKPLAKSRLFVLSLEEVPAALSGADCLPNLFSLAPPFAGPHHLLGSFLVAEGVRKLVVLAPHTGLGEQAVAALRQTFSFDLTVLSPKLGAATYDRELRRIGEIRPDAVYSLLTGGMGGAFVRAYAEAGGKDLAPLYTDSDALARPALPALGDAALDVRAVVNWTADQDIPGNKRFLGDFEVEFGRPPSEHAARGYDTVLLLDAAMKATGGKTGDSEALRAAFRRAEFASVRGAFHFNHNHQPILAYHLIQVERDQRGRLGHETVTTLAKEWRDPGTGACPMHWPEEYVPVVPKVGKRPS